MIGVNHLHPAIYILVSNKFQEKLSGSFVVLGLELRAFTLSLHQPYFCGGFFEIGSLGTLCLGWL
jgi:hypothetical protein